MNPSGKPTIMVMPKRVQFLSSFKSQQDWILPYNIICYITKFPSNSKGYQKLIRTCKYFFIKNPIIVIRRLYLNWENVAFLNHFARPFDMTNAVCKLWVTDVFNCAVWESRTPRSRTSAMIPKIYRCDAKELRLSKQDISFNEFMFLSSNLEKLSLSSSIVKNEDGSDVPLKTLIQYCVNLKEIAFFDSSASSSVTSSTADELLKLPQFSKNEKIILRKYPDTPPFATHFICTKDYSDTKVSIRYNNSIPG